MSRNVAYRLGKADLAGYSAELIADWCECSYRTALDYKRGNKPMSPWAAKLFVLHRDGKVLDHEAWRGWRVDGDVLSQPFLKGYTWTPGQLFSEFWLRQELQSRRRQAAKDGSSVPGSPEVVQLGVIGNK